MQRYYPLEWRTRKTRHNQNSSHAQTHCVTSSSIPATAVETSGCFAPPFGCGFTEGYWESAAGGTHPYCGTEAVVLAAVEADRRQCAAAKMRAPGGSIKVIIAAGAATRQSYARNSRQRSKKGSERKLPCGDESDDCDESDDGGECDGGDESDYGGESDGGDVSDDGGEDDGDESGDGGAQSALPQRGFTGKGKRKVRRA